MITRRAPSSLGRALKRGALFLSVLFNLSIGVLALWFFLRPGAVHVPFFKPHRVVTHPQVEYKDFVAILLTALAVMIGLGSGLVAVLAIFGYSEGRKMIERLVKAEVTAHLLPTLARIQMDQNPSETTAAQADKIAHALDDADGS